MAFDYLHTETHTVGDKTIACCKVCNHGYFIDVGCRYCAKTIDLSPTVRPESSFSWKRPQVPITQNKRPEAKIKPIISKTKPEKVKLNDIQLVGVIKRVSRIKTDGEVQTILHHYKLGSSSRLYKAKTGYNSLTYSKALKYIKWEEEKISRQLTEKQNEVSNG